MAKVKEKTEPVIETSLVAPTSFATMPATTQDAIRLSEMIAGSDLAPKDFKGKPGNCYIALQLGAEVGLSPMQSIQDIAVINGRPTIYGKAGKGLLLAHGCRIEERDIKDVERLGEAWCKITRPDGSKPTIRTFSKANAIEAKLWGKSGPWTEYPYRMMAWRAFWFAANDGAADYLKGLRGAEEARDYVETTADEAAIDETIPPPQRASESALMETVDPKTGEVVSEPPDEHARKKPNPSWVLIKAKRESACASCADEVMVGNEIYWDKPAGKVHHKEHFLNG